MCNTRKGIKVPRERESISQTYVSDKRTACQVVAHSLSPRTQEAEAGGSLRFKTRLVYGVSSGTAKAAQHSETLS